MTNAADRSHGHRRSAHHLLRQRRGRRQRALRRSTYAAPTTGRSVCARRWPTATTSPRSRCSTASAWNLAADCRLTGISTFGGDFGLALTLGGGEVKLLNSPPRSACWTTAKPCGAGDWGD
ncbi:MAG: hypothetical protein R3A10_23150 [Caldilineaceae bacterium]